MNYFKDMNRLRMNSKVGALQDELMKMLDESDLSFADKKEILLGLYVREVEKRKESLKK